MSAFVVSSIKPSLNIDANQRFIFGLEGSPEPLGSFKLDNIFIPIVGSPSLTNFETRNNTLSGYRWVHETTNTDTYGSLKLKRFLTGDLVGSELMSFNQDGTISFIAPVIDNTFGPNVALPFIQLNYNWNNPSIISPSTFIFNHNLTDIFDFTKKYTYSVNSQGRGWNVKYDLGDLSDPYGFFDIEYFTPTLTALPFRISMGPGSNAGISMTGISNITGTLSVSSSITATGVINAQSGIVCSNNIDMQNNFKVIKALDPTNPQDLVTKSYVDSAVDNSFGPNVALPFSQLNFNWSYVSVTDPTPYQFINTFTDTQVSKNFKYRVSTTDIGSREWNHNYTLIGNSDLNGIYQINYVGGGSTFTPINIVIYPFAASQNLMSITVPMDMGGFEVLNALNPTTAQSLATKNYVDTRTITLTGSVVGSGTSSILTTFSAIQTVAGSTQTFNYSNLLTSSIFSLVNTNASAVTQFQAGTSTDYIQLGYDGANDYSIINLQGASNDRLAFRANGTGIAALLFSGLFGLGTITPTLGKLQINGGVQNIVGEETALHVRSSLNNVKIELQSTAVGGKLYEFRSSSTGAFDITDRTGGATRFTIDTTGNVIVAGTYYGRRPSGLITMNGNVVGTTVVTANTYYKVIGTTNSSNLNQVTSPLSNRITHTSTITVIASIICSITASHSGAGGDDMFFSLFKNGTQLTNTVTYSEGSNNSPKSHSINTLISMATNDYIELWCSHSANAKIVTVQNLALQYSTT